MEVFYHKPPARGLAREEGQADHRPERGRWSADLPSGRPPKVPRSRLHNAYAAQAVKRASSPNGRVPSSQRKACGFPKKGLFSLEERGLNSQRQGAGMPRRKGRDAKENGQAPFFSQGTARPLWEKVPSSLGEKRILFGKTTFSRRGDSPRPSRTPDAGAGAAHSSRHLKRSRDLPCSFKSAAPHRCAPATQAPTNRGRPQPSGSSLQHGAFPPPNA